LDYLKEKRGGGGYSEYLSVGEINQESNQIIGEKQWI
jgi:hypothetical protein